MISEVAADWLELMLVHCIMQPSITSASEQQEMYSIMLNHCPNGNHSAAYTGWAKKHRTCLKVDNSALVSGRKSCDTSKVSECCKELTTNLHSEAFKYFCLICINIHHP